MIMQTLVHILSKIISRKCACAGAIIPTYLPIGGQGSGGPISPALGGRDDPGTRQAARMERGDTQGKERAHTYVSEM